MQNVRLKIIIRGLVQGVGFRPTVFRLAQDSGMAGWVSNSSDGVLMECEGERRACYDFVQAVCDEKIPNAHMMSCEIVELDPAGYEGFEIRESETGDPEALILPDIATCPECRKEIFDPQNRRYRYPFTNCTHCGPRYSVVEAIPYDRANTTMKIFDMCPDCRREYEDAKDRRFHAQPNACPVCGPHLELWDAGGKCLAEEDDALRQAGKAILSGKIVAVKGLGGFQLMVDARSQDAVERLRERKNRAAKPFAVMMCSLNDVQEQCVVSNEEEKLLSCSASPIVLLQKKEGTNIAESVAGGNPYLGVMLPYTPLHLLLMDDIGIPVVATSGNLSEEPMCIDEQEALKDLSGIADYFLVHNRPIARAVDDPVARVVLGREMILRRARGFAPLPVILREPVKEDVLAVGGHLKNTIAVAKGRNIFVSQHIGDLETEKSYLAFENTIKDLCNMYAVDPSLVVCDEHPEYLSTKYAKKQKGNVIEIQHHYAHTFSCMGENDLDDDILGVSWDGTGYGPDETVWGGEFISMKDGKAKRIASFRPFMLPGGEKAILEPRRAALGFLYSRYGDKLFEKNAFGLLAHFTQEEIKNLRVIMLKDLQCPLTSSVGRLFDAVAAFLNMRDVLQFEGQAAMEVEFAAERVKTDEAFSFTVAEPRAPSNEKFFEIDIPLAEQIDADLKENVKKETVSAKFHNTLAETIIAIAQKTGHKKIALSGGCFQNRYLLERAVCRLREEGFQPYWHQRIPTGDGGIALGQIFACAKMTLRHSTLDARSH